MATSFELEIRPRSGWQPVDLHELWHYRELLGFLVWRDIAIRYRQTLLGSLWAVLQPMIGMLVFTLVFHRWAGIDGDGSPYPLFVYAGLLAWTFFANAVSFSSNSLVGNQALVSKVYFPRMLMPLGSLGAFLLDMLIGLLLLGGLLVYYGWPLSHQVVLFPVFVLGCVLAASGFSLILSALNVYFRDIKYAVPFFVQIGIFITPVFYPVAYIPDEYQGLAGLNPIAGMVEGFRYSLLGSDPHWILMGISLATCVGLFFAGLCIFRRMESRFADVI